MLAKSSGFSMHLFRLLLLVAFFSWSAPEWRVQEDADAPDSIEHQEVVLLAVKYRQQVSERICEAHLGVFPIADTETSLLSQSAGMHACAAIRLPSRQSDPCCSYMSMQC